jgi:hypothetical protein
VLPIEELNFSKVAIKYSGELTKDQAFTGWRLLVRQIGDVIGQGRAANLEFSFGKLVAKERDARFAFSAALYIAHDLEVPVGAAEDIDYKPCATFAATDSSSLQGLSLKGSTMLEQIGKTGSSNLRVASKPGQLPESSAEPVQIDSLSCLQRTTSQEGFGMVIATDKQRDSQQGSMSSFGQAGYHQQQQMASDGWAYIADGKADVLTLCRETPGATSRTDGGSWLQSNPVAVTNRSSTSSTGFVKPSSSLQVDLSDASSALQAQQAETHDAALQSHISDLEKRASSNLQERTTSDEQCQDARAEADRRSQRCEHASSALQAHRAETYEAALHSIISDLEKRASSKLQERTTIDEQVQQHLAEDARAEADRRSQRREHASFLRQQIQAKVREREQAACEVPASPPKSGEVCPASGNVSSAARPANAFRDALDAQVLAKRMQREKQLALERRFEACMIEADKEELQAFHSFEKESKACEKESLASAWREEKRLKDMFKSLASDVGKRGPSSRLGTGRLSSRGTPRALLCPNSARGIGSSYGADSLGAAASLALQIKPVAVV